MTVARGWGERRKNLHLMGTELQFCKMERILGMDGGDGHTIM